MTKRHISWRWLLVVLPIGGLAALLAFGPPAWSSSPDAEAPPEAPRALPVAAVFPEAAPGYEAGRAYTGEVRARRTSTLGFEVAARIKTLTVAEGSPVTEKAILGTLDTRRLDTERARLDARRKAAAAVLAEMRAGPREEVVAAAEAAVEGAAADMELLERKKTRRAELLDRKRISKEEYDEIGTELRAARARLDGARERLRELNNGTRPEQIEAQAAQVLELENAIKRIDVDLTDSVLKAPFAGRVLTRHVDEGTVVQAGQPVFTLVEDAHLEAWIGLPPDVAATLEPGSIHKVRIRSRRFDATLRERLPETERATRTRTLVFELPKGAADHVVPGQVARLELERFTAAEGYWVPVSSLSRGVRGLWAVYALQRVQSEDAGPDVYEVVRHHVEVLHTGADRVLVRGTIGAEDRVVTGDTRRIVPGQRVTWTPSAR
ncbi:MAG: HlyD family efflux transporter periplasmic adaptor subunit [Planctomycetota bacterium]|nr:HlyD family efflux transporter periplasmic adaptor subunit [Planctomycetota bacterium]